MNQTETTRRIMFECRSASIPPIIRLKGQWLVDAGFTPGKHVYVTIARPGELVIHQTINVVDAVENARLRALASFAAVGV